MSQPTDLGFKRSRITVKVTVRVSESAPSASAERAHTSGVFCALCHLLHVAVNMRTSYNLVELFQR